LLIDELAYIAVVALSDDCSLVAFCERLRQLRHEAGGPAVESLARNKDVPLRRTQIYDVLNGSVQRPPSWDFVRAFVTVCAQRAEEHNRNLTVPTDLGGWQEAHRRLVQAWQKNRDEIPQRPLS
jgi:hypothetical protein